MKELPKLPFDNPAVLGIAPRMRALQQEGPVARVRTAGEDAWLVTRYDEVRALLADRRLGLSNPYPERSVKSAARSTMMALMAGDDYATEATDHPLMRELLVPRFSTRRMRLMKTRIERHVDELLDEMAAGPAPADLHRALSFPLPTMVVCDLLGVPWGDRERFGQWARGTFDQSDGRHSANTFQQVVDYMTELVARKRIEPGDDILSELIAEKNGTLSDAYIAQLGCAVLLFGYETTIVRIDLGTLLLLRNPDQRALLAEKPELAPAAVEEILRLAVGGKGSNALIPRYAHSDITVGDTVIRTGDAVLLAIGAGNIDGRAFPDADLFDLTRDKPKSHLAFGHGTRHCIGRVLARIELTAVFERLFRRLPDLRLAVSEESLRWQEHRITGGFDEIPVTF
ncbi:pentalenolactone synthase [Streptomyces albireticuli]|uniref:Pentalenolactone synthase n=1 Tax=Streptomyces albireticuli TaxID=1940 RepID=A0A2A2DBI8_9ACTN|nr:cytochrome P450 [Streptomyces albireticuli]MCD9141394.1 cytochrome P450 [Streptomyces albireticuli]MCD9160645.1 cytochrome P450 [Streptomyces albireticuli]MCD9195799.1 cytochrome P450 [Streptomyces albireticuli]PAU48662.1 pentalenolactone synthase [Streptomyces albireticuli]